MGTQVLFFQPKKLSLIDSQYFRCFENPCQEKVSCEEIFPLALMTFLLFSAYFSPFLLSFYFFTFFSLYLDQGKKAAHDYLVHYPTFFLFYLSIFFSFLILSEASFPFLKVWMKFFLKPSMTLRTFHS